MIYNIYSWMFTFIIIAGCWLVVAVVVPVAVWRVTVVAVVAIRVHGLSTSFRLI